MFNLLMFFIIFIIYLLFYNKKDKSNLLFLRVIFLIFTFIVAFRAYSMGNDTQTYLNIFDNCSFYKWGMLDTIRYEKGYLIFNILLGYLKINHRLFLIIFSVIFNYGIYRFIKENSKDYFLSVIMYLGLLYFYLSMTMYRQFFAIVIILYAFKYVKNKQFFKYLFFIMLAVSFHNTALIALLLYPIYHIKFTKKRALTLLFISILCLIFINPVLNAILQFGYFNYSYEIREVGFSLANTLYAIVFLCMFIFSYSKYKKDSNDGNNYDFIMYIFFISFCLDLIAIRMNVFNRMAEYYSIFSIVCLPNIIDTFKIKNNRKIIYIILLVLMLSYSSIIIYFRPEWNSSFNYKICSTNNDCFK